MTSKSGAIPTIIGCKLGVLGRMTSKSEAIPTIICWLVGGLGEMTSKSGMGVHSDDQTAWGQSSSQQMPSKFPVVRWPYVSKGASLPINGCKVDVSIQWRLVKTKDAITLFRCPGGVIFRWCQQYRYLIVGIIESLLIYRRCQHNNTGGQQWRKTLAYLYLNLKI